MTRRMVFRNLGATIEGQTIYCEYRKAGRERPIRKTGTHRGRSTVLDNALCSIQKPYSRYAVQETNPLRSKQERDP